MMTTTDAAAFIAWLDQAKSTEFIAWLDQAKSTDAADPTTAAALIALLSGSKFLQRPSVSEKRDHHGHVLIEFWPPAPTTISEPRRFKTIYAAITHGIELAGGEISYGPNRDLGRDRFKLWISFGGRQTTYPRILFGVPDGGRLNERPDSYHDIVPASFEFRHSPNRDDLIAWARGRHGDELADLLGNLFALADKWHGSELEIVADRIHAKQHPAIEADDDDDTE